MNITDLKMKKMEARKQGSAIAVSAIDGVLAEIDLIEARNNKNLDEDAIMSVIKKTISQLNESKEMYIRGKRQEMVDECVAKISFLETFLPQQLTEDQIKCAAEQTIEDVNATSMKDMGKVMGELKKTFGASLDMGFASNFVKQKLS